MCFLTLCERNFNRKLAYRFLEDLSQVSFSSINRMLVCYLLQLYSINRGYLCSNRMNLGRRSFTASTGRGSARRRGPTPSSSSTRTSRRPRGRTRTAGAAGEVGKSTDSVRFWVTSGAAFWPFFCPIELGTELQYNVSHPLKFCGSCFHSSFSQLKTSFGPPAPQWSRLSLEEESKREPQNVFLEWPRHGV